MSYNTKYQLSIIHPADDAHLHVIEHLRDSYRDAFYALAYNGISKGVCKWGDHVEDITKFSCEYPDIIFQLDGRGDDCDDIWRKYFKNGRVQQCEFEIIFDDYDEDLLV